MAHVRDRWTDPNPDGPDARPKRVHNDHWGKGKRWQAVWADDAGRRLAKACTAKDEAEKIIRDRDGQTAPVRPILVAEWIRGWADGQLHWSAGTREQAMISIESMILPSLKGATVQSLTRARVQAAVAQWAEVYAPSTIHARWGWLSGPLQQAVQDGLISRNPCVGVRLPRVEHRLPFFPTTAQVIAITAAMTPRLRTMVTVAAGTGMRSGELRGLTWDRICGRVITVDRQLMHDSGLSWGPVKNRRPRTVLAGDTVAAALEEQRQTWGPGVEGLVWHSRTRWHGPISHNGAAEGWRNATEGMGFPARTGWHALRHYHASLLISAGMSPRAVADRLGHADVAETLRTYAHLWPGSSELMAAVFDDEILRTVSDRGATRDSESGSD